jgi:truncated hemoglobin YjbI
MADENKIPTEIARELRALAHDLSNSLETILQATYLVSETDLPEGTRRWMEMMDQASQEAIQINRKLREILRSQT